MGGARGGGLGLGPCRSAYSSYCSFASTLGPLPEKNKWGREWALIVRSRIKFSFMNRQCEANQKKSAKLKLSSVCFAYSGSVLCCANILAQLSSRSFRVFLVIAAFRSFLFYGRSSIPVVSAFLRSLRSLWKQYKFKKGENKQIIHRSLPIDKEISY